MTEPATDEQIVTTFERLPYREITNHNWGTCGRDCGQNWSANEETYINGVIMTLDFDFVMGYLVEAVDRTTLRCRYIAIILRHGPRSDGTYDDAWDVCPIERQFFDHADDLPLICQWAVSSIYRMR